MNIIDQTNMVFVDPTLAYKTGILEERVRVMKIVRSMKAHNAVNNEEMARLCVELFRCDVMEAISNG